VVIIPVGGRVVYAANVDDSVAVLQFSWVARADEGGGCICGEQAEEVNGQGFVGVEVAAVMVSTCPS
jgi:hypothetical protein